MVAWKYGPGWPAMAALVYTWFLLAASVIDVRHQLLPDDLVLPLLWLGLFAALFGLFADLPSAVIGAMAGYLTLWSVYQLFRLLTGKEGMGHGDFKLLAALGAWAGWQYLVAIVLLSSLVGEISWMVDPPTVRKATSYPSPCMSSRCSTSTPNVSRCSAMASMRRRSWGRCRTRRNWPRWKPSPKRRGTMAAVSSAAAGAAPAPAISTSRR